MPRDASAAAVDSLLSRFRRQKPLRSGSLLVTILGDAITPRGGTITLGSLIRLAEPFGLTERLVRTSVGRLAKEGWLTSRREGRQSEYGLTRRGKSRFAEATQRIYAAPPHTWERRWTLMLLPASAGKARETIRKEMCWLGFGQVTSGVLAHPMRSLADTQAQLKELGMSGRAIVLEAASAGPAHDRQLIELGWDLGELARGYRRFVESFETVRSVFKQGNAIDPQRAFVVRTLLIHEYRKVHLRDPLLPSELLPSEWIGAQAYDLCRDLYRRVFPQAEVYLSASAARLSAPLAPFANEHAQRFAPL